MTPVSFRRLLPALALLVAALASAPASAGSYDTLVVFGDSLSDNGNNAATGLVDPLQVITGNTYIPSKTYAPGTYSNGLVWAIVSARSPQARRPRSLPPTVISWTSART